MPKSHVLAHLSIQFIFSLILAVMGMCNSATSFFYWSIRIKFSYFMT